MIRTMHGERDICKNCPWCGGIFADEENRLWTVCNTSHCIYPPEKRKVV